MSLYVYLNSRGEVIFEDRYSWQDGWLVENTAMASEKELEEDRYDEEPPKDYLEGQLDLFESEDPDILASGKGDNYRPVNKDEYGKNHDQVFGEKPKHVCRKYIRDKQGVSVCYHCNEPELDQVIDPKKHREDLSNK